MSNMKFIKCFILVCAIVLIGHASSSYGVAKIDAKQSVCFVQEQPQSIVADLAVCYTDSASFDVCSPTICNQVTDEISVVSIEPIEKPVCSRRGSGYKYTLSHQKIVVSNWNVRHANTASRYSYGVNN